VPHLPLNIAMHGRRVLVVGGGTVAGRKVGALLRAQASIHLVAPAISAELAALEAAGRITSRSGPYQASDLQGVFLAVAASDSSEVNARMASDARRLGILAAVADAPDLGDCTFPALLRRGELEIAVSTGGRCPAFAAQVRDLISGLIGDGYGDALEQLSAEREKLLTEGNSSTYNKQVLRTLAERLINQLTEHKERVP